MKTLNKKKSLFILCLTALICFITSFAIFANVAKADTVAVTEGRAEIYQLAPDPYSLNQSYVIKTAEGKLIVIDGGIDGPDNKEVAGVNGINATPYITSALRAIAGVGAGEAFEVEAWFLSHAHCDHYLELAKILNAYTSNPRFTGIDITGDGTNDIALSKDTNFTINNFYFDFPKDIATNDNINGDYSKTLLQVLVDGFETYAEENEITYDTNTYSSYYDSLNGSVINADMIKNDGWMNIAGLDFEFLQTHNVKDTSVNSNSLVFRVWLDGQSVLFLNDATEESGRRLIKTYGADFIKSDIVQMAHHGQAGVDAAAYNAIDAEVRLWAASKSVWFDMDTTKAVRGWVGLPEEAFSANTTKDLVAALSTHPTDFTSVDAWAEVIDGMKISFPYDGAYKADIQMNEGAGIRLTDGSTGIRFSATLTKYDTDATYGFVIAPTSYFTKHSITSEYVEQLTTHYGADGFINIATAVLPQGMHYIMQGSIANIKYQNMNRSFTGIAYELKDGVYTYAQYDSLSDISRSVKNVAVDAYNYHYYDENGEYYETEDLDIINGFVKSAIDQANGISEADSKTANTSFDLAMTSTSETLEWAETVDLGFSSPYANEDIKWSYDSSVVEITDGVVKAVGVGSTTVTASCFGKSVSANITVSEEEGYLASFDKEAYTVTAEKNTRSLRDAAYLTAEWQESVTDSKGITENGVLTVTSSANIYDAGIADIVIDLPKPATTAGVTVRLMIEKSNATHIYFRGEKTTGVYDPGYSSRIIHPSTGAAEFTSVNDAKGKWLTYFVDYSAAERFDKLELLVVGGGTLAQTVIHFAAVLPGNQVDDIKYGDIKAGLASTLPNGYFAKFDNEEYLGLVSTTTADVSIDNFDGVDVLKVSSKTLNANSWGKVDIVLPKAHTGTYSVKFYLASVSEGTIPNYFRINNVTGETFNDKSYDDGAPSNIVNQWTTLENITARDTKAYGKFNFMWINTATTCDMVLYVACIYDKEEMLAGTKAALASALPNGYAAKYDNEDYLNFVSFGENGGGMTSGYNVDKAETSIDNKGGISALKIDITDTSWGSFTLILPKEYEEKGYTFKYYFEYHYAADGVTKLGVPSNFRVNTDVSASQDIEWTSLIFNSWTLYSGDNKPGHARDSFTFSWINTSGSGSSNFTLYIASFFDIDTVKDSLADNLEENYLADFSSEEYLDFVNGHTDLNGTMTKEILPLFNGETNVLKLVVDEPDTGFNVNVTLPKAPTNGKITVRWMVADKVNSTDTTTLTMPSALLLTNDSNQDLCSSVTSKPNVWINTVSSSTVTDTFRVKTWNANGAHKVVVYIAFVMDGDQTAYLNYKEELDSLGAGYCVDFNASNTGDLLAKVTTNSTYAVDTFSATPTTFDGSTVAKIEITDTGWGAFTLTLPKAYVSGDYSIRFYMENKGGANYPDYFRINNDPTFNEVKYDIEYGPSTSPSNASIWNTWNVFSPSTGANSKVTDYTKIVFVYYNSSGSSDFTMYIDYVIDADLASYVTEGYCADFANPVYLDMVSMTSAVHAPANGTYGSEIVKNHSGETNVLKLTIATNSSTNGTMFGIKLPVAHSGKYTLRIMLADNDGTNNVTVPATIRLREGSGSGSDLHEFSMTKLNIWQDLVITQTDTENLHFYIYGVGATAVIYISFVYDGDLAEDLSSVNSLPTSSKEVIIFADCPPMNDSTRLGWYKDAGFTHYLMTEDYVSLFTNADNGDYSLNPDYLAAMERAVAADLEVIMRNMTNDPHYFDNLSATDIEKLNSLVVGYYMCDEPAIAEGYGHTYIEQIEQYLVAWFNENGKDEFFHVNLLQSYGMSIMHGTTNPPTFSEYLNTYVERVLKNVNGTVTLSTDHYPVLTDDTLSSSYLYDLILIANTARDLKLVGYDVIVNYCIQMCENAGLNLRQPESIEEIRLQTNLALALGASSLEYYDYYNFILDNHESSSTDYEWVKQVNSEVAATASAILDYNFVGAQFISCGNNTVEGLDGLTVSKFNKLKGVTATADTLVSEFKKASGEYAYMAVNYNTLNTQSEASTVTFTFAAGTTAAVVIIDGVSQVVNVVANTLAVELAAGSSVVVYPTVM